MNELSKNLQCLILRNGIEFWLEKERLDKLRPIMEVKRFVDIGDETINVADITGIFNASSMEENTRRKNGQWKCKQGTWHDRKDKCECKPLPVCKICGKTAINYVYSNGVICMDCR